MAETTTGLTPEASPVVADDDPKFWPAVAAAMIDDELAAAKASVVTVKEAFSREHVEQLRAAGCTREDARSYFVSVFGEQLVSNPVTRKLRPVVEVLMDDLDSYGPWAEEA